VSACELCWCLASTPRGVGACVPPTSLACSLKVCLTREGTWSVSVEVGVPLFDELRTRDGVIWVYYPLEVVPHGWRCDLMTIHGDVVDVRASVTFSDRFLLSCQEELTNE